MAEECSGCRFWLGVGETFSDGEPNGWGWCRRNPPQISDHMAEMVIPRPRFGGDLETYDPDRVATVENVADASLFPATFYDRWCGRWEARS